MNADEFWMSLLSNSLGTLLAGTILGFFVSWLLNLEEKKLADWEKELLTTKKTLDFLLTIEEEIKDIRTNFDIKKPIFYESTSLKYLWLDTSYWEILKTSGEIPNLFEPSILQIFTNFYSIVNQCNKLYEQFIMAEVNKSGNVESMVHAELIQYLHSLDNIFQSINIELILQQVIDSTNFKIKEVEGRFPKSKRGKKAQSPDNR